MKSITFRADERAIEKARKDFDVESFLKRFEYVEVNSKVTRDEANER